MDACVIPRSGWRIHNYKNPENILMGYEYEIDVRQTEKRTQRVNELLPKHYSWCHECLGATYGYEIKSSVAPLRTLKREASALMELWNWCVIPQNEGGIHINVSRNQYTKTNQQKVFAFLHNPSHYDYFYRLSKRNSNSFQANAQQDLSYTGGHYGIITTRKHYAYEFRMFGAEPGLILPAMEMIHALFDLAPGVDSISINAFEQHVRSYPRYKEMKSLLNEHHSLHSHAA